MKAHRSHDGYGSSPMADAEICTCDPTAEGIQSCG